MTAYEQETLINYNMEEKTAICSTFDRFLIAKLDELVAKSSEIQCTKRRDGYAEYTFPKRWVKIRMPRQMTEEERQIMAERGRALYAAQQKKREGGDDDGENNPSEDREEYGPSPAQPFRRADSA